MTTNPATALFLEFRRCPEAAIRQLRRLTAEDLASARTELEHMHASTGTPLVDRAMCLALINAMRRKGKPSPATNTKGT